MLGSFHILSSSCYYPTIPANVHTSYLVRFGMGGVLWDRSLTRPVGETARVERPGEVDAAGFHIKSGLSAIERKWNTHQPFV